MCTYNGESYLPAQLDSFQAQSHSDWKLFVSDDGSRDGTRTVLERYRRNWPERHVAFYAGPGRGFVANFLSLVCRPAVAADYYAYADQDDIWFPDKLERAVSWLKGVPAHLPALYCSSTLLVDAGNREIRHSPAFSRAPAFRNAIVQNIASGNTMVFNNAARDLLCAGGVDLSVPAHDWWTYIAVTACGGTVFFDGRPSVRYRQHGGNVIGIGDGWLDRIARQKMAWRGRFKTWTDMNVAALAKVEQKLSPDSRRVLEQFVGSRRAGLMGRLRGLLQAKIYRQTLVGNLTLVAATILKRI